MTSHMGRKESGAIQLVVEATGKNAVSLVSVDDRLPMSQKSGSVCFAVR